MQIAILKTGQPPPELDAPSYPAMIRSALGSGYTYLEFDVSGGELPSAQSTAGAYVITGSAASAYDAHPWIDRLRDWLRELDRATPVVGFCFGHQIMAQAYGGVVERSSKGLAVGLHEYEVSSRETWMDDVSRFVLPVSHHDQVVRLPPVSRIVARSDFCPYAALSYGDRRAMSFQGHPEFQLDFVARAIDRCQQRGTIGAAQAEQARASLQRPDDRARVFSWVGRFLGAMR